MGMDLVKGAGGKERHRCPGHDSKMSFQNMSCLVQFHVLSEDEHHRPPWWP